MGAKNPDTSCSSLSRSRSLDVGPKRSLSLCPKALRDTTKIRAPPQGSNHKRSKTSGLVPRQRGGENEDLPRRKRRRPRQPPAPCSLTDSRSTPCSSTTAVTDKAKAFPEKKEPSAESVGTFCISTGKDNPLNSPRPAATPPHEGNLKP